MNDGAGAKIRGVRGLSGSEGSGEEQVNDGAAYGEALQLSRAGLFQK